MCLGLSATEQRPDEWRYYQHISWGVLKHHLNNRSLNKLKAQRWKRNLTPGRYLKMERLGLRYDFRIGICSEIWACRCSGRTRPSRLVGREGRGNPLSVLQWRR